MKKNDPKQRHRRCPMLRKMLNIMKLTTLLFFLALFQVTANSYAQKTRLNLKFEKEKLESVFSKIEENSEFSIFYTNKLVKDSKLVSGEYKNALISDVLDQVLKSENLGYTIKDKLILIVPMEESSDGSTAQQEKSVSGKVTDSSGMPLPGVSVVVKGTTNGTTTDGGGNYQISNIQENATLQFSFVGMKTREVIFKGKTKVDMVLLEETFGVDEVVIVAYGQQSKSTLTGAIQSISAEKLNVITTPFVAGMMQSAASGVMVTNETGIPGIKPVIRVRGDGSLNFTNEPLWVIDGVIYGTTAPEVNPSDIESISILKDASASSLYGSRASNGVILVQTKSGKANTSAFNFTSNTGISQLNQGEFSMMNGQQLYNLLSPLGSTQNYPDPNSDAVKKGTSWIDLATKTGMIHDYNLSYRGGTDKTMVFTSFGYYNEKGAVVGHDWKRFSGRVNLDYYASDRVKLMAKLGGVFQNRLNNENGALQTSYLNLPWDNPYFADGRIKTGETELDGMKWYGRDRVNFLYNKQYNFIRNRDVQYLTDLGFEIKLTNWLTATSNNRLRVDVGRWEQILDSRTRDGRAEMGRLYNENSYNCELFTSNIFRFNHKFEKHNIFGIAGQEYSKSYYDVTGADGKGIYPSLEILSAASTPRGVMGQKTEYAFLSFLSNVQYVYNDKYMAQFSFRRDGSSRFGANNRFGNFYSVGASWSVHKEDFMKSVPFVNNLKLRGSYGSVGNANISDFVAMGLYRMTVQYNGIPGGSPSRLANPDLTWESNYNANIAVDARLFNRLNITVDLYNKKTENLLQDVPLPTVSGYNTIIDNIGSVRNRGVEIMVNGDIVTTEDFLWNADFNISFNKNKVLKLNGGKDILRYLKVTHEGSDMNTWYMRKWMGVDPQNGNPLWQKVTTNADGSVVISNTSNYTEATIQRVGTSSPDFFGGFTNHFAYKGISLIANFYFNYGNKIYHGNRVLFDNDGAYPDYNLMNLHEGWSRWEKPGDIATHPKPMLGGNNSAQLPSSRQLEDGSYIRLKYLTLAYDLPELLIRKSGLKKVRVKLTGENLWTATKFSGIDPEVAFGGFVGGIEGGVSPVVRRYVLGLDINF